MRLFGLSPSPPPAPPVVNVGDFLAALGAYARPAGRGDFAFVRPDGHSRGFVQFIIASDRKLTLHRLWTLRPGQGNGSFMLRTVCELADRYCVELRLKALPIGRKPYPLTRDQLADWYRRHGFVGPHKKMLRQPRCA